jgi:hypothetical protein
MKKLVTLLLLSFNLSLFSQCVDTVWIPNAIVPDGYNQSFQPHVPGGQEWEMLIFTRNGDLIFQSNGTAWNGYYKGEIRQTEIFVYKITIFGNDCVRREFGTVTLLKKS